MLDIIVIIFKESVPKTLLVEVGPEKFKNPLRWLQQDDTGVRAPLKTGGRITK